MALRLTEVAPHVYRLGVPTSGVFLLLDETITLIDTGPRWSHRRIFEAIRELGRSPDEIEQVVITHGHFDHYGSARDIRRLASPSSLRAHPLDVPEVCGERIAPLPVPLGWFIQRTVGRVLGPKCPIEEPLEGGLVSPVLGGLYALHTPGHTAGHTAFHLPQLGVLFTGDAIEVRGGEVVAPRIREDEAAARASIRLLAEVEADVLAPSHFPTQHGAVRERLLAAVG